MKPPVYSHWATLRDRFPVLRIPFTAVASVCAVCVLLGARGRGWGWAVGGGVVLSRGSHVQAFGPKFLQNQVLPLVGAVVHMI